LYLIVVYDIEVERIDKVRAILKRYLFWVQNSVFEGESNEASLQSMVQEVRRVIKEDYDSIVIYEMNSPKTFKRTLLGMDLSLRGFVV